MPNFPISNVQKKRKSKIHFLGIMILYFLYQFIIVGQCRAVARKRTASRSMNQCWSSAGAAARPPEGPGAPQWHPARQMFVALGPKRELQRGQQNQSQRPGSRNRRPLDWLQQTKTPAHRASAPPPRNQAATSLLAKLTRQQPIIQVKHAQSCTSLRGARGAPGAKAGEP